MTRLGAIPVGKTAMFLFLLRVLQDSAHAHSKQKLATPKMPALPSADGMRIHRKMPLTGGLQRDQKTGSQRFRA